MIMQNYFRMRLNSIKKINCSFLNRVFLKYKSKKRYVYISEKSAAVTGKLILVEIENL